MIRRVFVLFMAICLLASPIAVYADMVWGNEFENQHKDVMQGLERSRFVANGPDGYVTPQQVPGEAKETVIFEWADDPMTLEKYQNGAELFMSSTYVHKGEYWGVQSIGHHVWMPGWVPMDQLLAVYTPGDFNRENKDSFYSYTGNADAIFGAERLVLWQWPGSDREKRVLDINICTIKDANILNAYKDIQGREWGYVKIDYIYSTNTYTSKTESWVCLTEPASSNIPPFYPAPQPAKWNPDGNLTWEHDSVLDDPYEQNSLLNIEKIREYEGSFADVPQGAWYKDAVVTAYEYGIIQGKGNNIFDPNGSLTVRETLIIASRIHAYYKYGKEEGNRWLSVYSYAYNGIGHAGRQFQYADVRYCEAEGLIKAGEFDDYYDFYEESDAPITRAQMVHAWAKILQPKDMAKQNTVIILPDVNTNTDYFDDIILFYESGIIGGVDDQGTFKPDNNITRAEAATIFMNLIDAAKRHSGRTYGN